MDSTSRRYDNVYWSWRRYLKANVEANLRVIYNPSDQPKPTDVDKWLIFLTGSYDARMFTESKPRLICVARQDPRDDILTDFISDTLEVIDRKGTGSKFINFYDKTSATVIGTIDVIRTMVGPTMQYDTGIDSISIDVFTRIKTDRNM